MSQKIIKCNQKVIKCFPKGDQVLQQNVIKCFWEVIKCFWEVIKCFQKVIKCSQTNHKMVEQRSQTPGNMSWPSSTYSRHGSGPPSLPLALRDIYFALGFAAHVANFLVPDVAKHWRWCRCPAPWVLPPTSLSIGAGADKYGKVRFSLVMALGAVPIALGFAAHVAEHWRWCRCSAPDFLEKLAPLVLGSYEFKFALRSLAKKCYTSVRPTLQCHAELRAVDFFVVYARGPNM